MRDRLRVGKAGVPRKLDTIGILPSEDIGLIEIKECNGDMSRAAVQAAAHVATIGALRRQAGSNLPAVLNEMVAQKTQARLLTEAKVPKATDSSRLVPIVAAPVEDGDDQWFDDWIAATADVRAAQVELLHGLQFWRLSSDGALMEVRVP